MPALPTELLIKSNNPKRMRTPEAGYSEQVSMASPRTVDVLDSIGESLDASGELLESIGDVQDMTPDCIVTGSVADG
jgi:hypothetical protein